MRWVRVPNPERRIVKMITPNLYNFLQKLSKHLLVSKVRCPYNIGAAVLLREIWVGLAWSDGGLIMTG